MTSKRGCKRDGAILIWCALLLVVMLGMLGLVIDGGLLMAAHRHAQNAADAAAMVATFDKLRGYRNSTARRRAGRFAIRADHNNLPNSTPTIHIPPIQGPYTGRPGFAEAIISSPVPTYFIHVLPGIDRDHSVVARAVAGYELVTATEALVTLNPHARPGLQLTGGGNLEIHGSLFVNSEGGGLDENGVPANSNEGLAISVESNAIIRASEVFAAGGVESSGSFQNIDPSGNQPLDADTNPVPDPLVFMRTPDINSGVVDVTRGRPEATDGQLQLNNDNDNSSTPNYIENPGQPNETMVLHPGIYESIHVTDGNVRFEPGIYVLRPDVAGTSTLIVTGGNVTAQGVMFYNTGSNYDPVYAVPDRYDRDHEPSAFGDVYYGGMIIEADIGLSGIDTTTHVYDPPVSDEFNGLLIYQRRWNESPLQIEGDSDPDGFIGTVYAKWADLSLVGGGTYDAQFIVGKLMLEALGDVVIRHDLSRVGKAPRAYLVE